MSTIVNSEIYKAIDKLNKRMQQIAEADDIYNTKLLKQKYEQILEAAIPSNYLKQGKYGLTISKSKEAQSNISLEQLQRLSTLETAGEFKQDLLQAAMEETGKTAEEVTIEDMRQISDDVETVRNAEDAHGKINYNADDAGYMQEAGTKSYHELAEIVRRYEAKLAEENKAKQNKVVSNYDNEHTASRKAKANRSRSAGDRVR